MIFVHDEKYLSDVHRANIVKITSKYVVNQLHIYYINPTKKLICLIELFVYHILITFKSKCTRGVFNYPTVTLSMKLPMINSNKYFSHNA